MALFRVASHSWIGILLLLWAPPLEVAPGARRKPSILIVEFSYPNVSFHPCELAGLTGIALVIPSLAQGNHEWSLNGAFSSLPSAYKKYTSPNVLGMCMASFLFSTADAGFSLLLYPLVIPLGWGWRAECSEPALTSPSDAEELRSLTLKCLWKLYGLWYPFL